MTTNAYSIVPCCVCPGRSLRVKALIWGDLIFCSADCIRKYIHRNRRFVVGDKVLIEVPPFENRLGVVDELGGSKDVQICSVYLQNPKQWAGLYNEEEISHVD